jgi:hypothetical protein
MNPFPFEKDPVIEAYKKDVDRTLIRQMLMRTTEERVETLQNWVEFTEELGEIGRKSASGALRR